VEDGEVESEGCVIDVVGDRPAQEGLGVPILGCWALGVGCWVFGCSV